MYKELISSLSDIAGGARHCGAADGISLDFDESKHPRGNPKNAGQFARKDGGHGGGGRKTSSPHVTPEQDRAYAEAVGKRDFTTCEKMVTELARRAFAGTAVASRDGSPMKVYHYGILGVDGLDDDDLPLGAKSAFVPREDTHFGTERSAEARREALESQGAWQAEKAEVNEFFLFIRNPADTRDGWGRANDRRFGANVRHDGSDGNRYVNSIEGAGDVSWMAYRPEQIKLADPITRDDDGNVIPLSQRFQMDNPDIRY